MTARRVTGLVLAGGRSSRFGRDKLAERIDGRTLLDSAIDGVTPAALRDATGTSRKYVMAILEDLDRRAILRRTPAGHVPGPKAPTVAAR